MIPEPPTITGERIAPLAQARPSALTGTHQREAEKRPNLSEIAELGAESQKKVHMLHSVDLTFSVHEASEEIMITVKGEATCEILREIPRSEVLHPAATIDEMIGILPSVKKRGNGKDRRKDRKGCWHRARSG